MAPQTTGPTFTAQGATAGGPTTMSSPDVPDPASIHNEQTRQDLELKLQELIECLLELSITVYDFQSESNQLVQQKIQDLIAQLSDIEGFKDKLDMMVPWEVLSYIEDGKNPDLFSKSFVEAVAGENQFTNGKITALKSFEAALTQNLGSAFPDEMVDYEQILQDMDAFNSSSNGNGSCTPVSNMIQSNDTSAMQLDGGENSNSHSNSNSISNSNSNSNNNSSGAINNAGSSSSSGSSSLSPPS